MGKTISTILNLKNNMSSGLVKVSTDLNKMSKQAKAATLEVKHMADNFQKRINGMVSGAGRLIKVGAGIAGAFALKTGLAEAMDLEGFRTQLETATKDTKRAAEVMKYAIDLANKTPFEGGELVEAASSLEMFGMKSERWLTVLGDAAAGVNRSMADIQSGFIKAATTGDFASLRDTLGITKEMVVAYSKTNLGGSFLNSKGQITNAERLQDALEGLLNERYAGGMEKLAKTTKGVWSTITGVTKNSLARIVGMQNDGTVKSGSMLDYIKQKATAFASMLERWQSDGTLDKIADGAAKGFQQFAQALSSVGQFAAEHKEQIVQIGAALAGFLVGGKVVSGLSKLVAGFKMLKNVLFVAAKGSLAFSPAGWIVLGITALVTAFVTAYRKSETFRNKVHELLAKFKEFASTLKTNVITKLQEAKAWFDEKIAPSLQKFGEMIMLVWEKIKPFAEWMGEIFGARVSAGIETAKKVLSTMFNGAKEWIEGAMKALGGFSEMISGLLSGDMQKAGEGLKTWLSGMMDAFVATVKTPANIIIELFNGIINTVNSISNVPIPDWVPGLGGKTLGWSIPNIPQFALGTQFFGGGLARINERGGEIVNLPNGSKVIPADKSRMGGGVTVQVIVQGNIIGNKDYADYLGNLIFGKIKAALANT